MKAVGSEPEHQDEGQEDGIAASAATDWSRADGYGGQEDGEGEKPRKEEDGIEELQGKIRVGM